VDKKDLEKRVNELTEDRLERLEDKTDKILDQISAINVTLAEQHKQLEHHIYRTDLAEKHLGVLETELKPVKAHVTQVNGILKVIGIAASLAGIGKLVIEIIKL
jgi:uncharacterized coiled-coil protein SlyX